MEEAFIRGQSLNKITYHCANNFMDILININKCTLNYIAAIVTVTKHNFSFQTDVEPHTPPIVFKQSIQRLDDVQPGQYILYKKKNDTQHLLTESINLEENELTAYVAKKGRISKMTLKYPQKKVELFEVTYEKDLGEVAPADVVLQRAEDLLIRKNDPSTPTQSKNETTSLDVIVEGEKANTEETTRDGILHASQFVTKCTLGKALTINDNCFQEYDAQPISHTVVTPHTC